MKLDSDIHNYFENMVMDRIQELEIVGSKGSDYIADLTCLALNLLPARYIRFDVDMAFYMPDSERQHMYMKVVKAVDDGIAFLDNHISPK